MRRDLRTGREELYLNWAERRFFRYPFKGKLRIAEAYTAVTSLRRRPFVGIAHLPVGKYWIDSEHRLDWAMLFGGMEQANVAWLQRTFARVRGAWDVGGHHGEYAIALAPLLEPGGVVHIFEPFPASAAQIERTLKTNGFEAQVSVHRQAIGDRDGAIELFLSDKGSQNHSTREWVGTGSAAVTVPVTTLDAALSLYGVPDIVKIDIEGGELAAFRGAPTLLSLRRTTFLFESELWDSNRSELHNLLSSSGYSLSGLHRGVEVASNGERMIVARPTP